MSASIAPASDLGVFATVRRGLAMSPAMRRGLGVTFVLALVATAGRLVVPVAVQQATDRGILAPGGVDVEVVTTIAAAALGVLLVATACSAWVNVRLFSATEAGLAQLRVGAFRHVHDLAVLTQHTERRGSLVSRVTSDVDTISMFVQWGGLMLVLSTLQIAAATVAMAIYSWQLTLVVWVTFVPMLILAPRAQRALNVAYALVRHKVGSMLASVSEAVVGAHTIRAYGAGARTGSRIEGAVRDHRDAAVRAQTLASVAFSAGVLSSGVALAAVVVAGTFLGIAGEITVGTLLAFLFLVQLFTGPVQSATEVLNELQNAVAGWRRVLSLVETPIEVAPPADPVDLGQRRALDVQLDGVSFSYPGGPRVLHDVDLRLPAGARVAVVGRTGSGKTTIARLVARLADPDAGAVRLGGVDVREIAPADLRTRVVVVPQEGFLFDATLADNIAYGRVPHSRAEVEQAVVDLGLVDWVAAFDAGLDTPAGQRGESLSAGERQLVALARAHLAGADLLVLDEATSAVDPATELRISRAFAELTRQRTSVTIAHRLSTAQAADLVVVVDGGRIVGVGPHAELLAADGVYSRMFASWVAQSAS
ncbi:ABC transporter related [Beutenbergia cavernae DSM 12333]|uniref:ABC transporter related n=1 Tax=Beutenbergia cavernae (strain ATCC BAA-8 / DSM 12333 / CCUG 43141 / JCM 11478 / NBRC 16432 / NCIMB 13614 / HKI 0122) TaxID=471853 RepID=C5BV94_BEUC1|nr:ABC transporter ATP-binding protein [Beutenbergia cavernae]ACQ80481.1 ABC transporter related [Beutenbergia cavernae DSM 12333]